MSATQPLRSILQENKKLSSLQIDQICEGFTEMELKNKAHLQLAGKPVRHVGFIVKGIVRGYLVNENNTEITKFF